MCRSNPRRRRSRMPRKTSRTSRQTTKHPKLPRLGRTLRISEEKCIQSFVMEFIHLGGGLLGGGGVITDEVW